MRKVDIKKEIKEKLVKIVSNQLGIEPDAIAPEASFSIDLGADSLDVVELVMAIEEKFDIEISDEKAEKIKTVGQAMEAISKAIA